MIAFEKVRETLLLTEDVGGRLEHDEEEKDTSVEKKAFSDLNLSFFLQFSSENYKK